MILHWPHKKLKKLLEDGKELQRKYGSKCAQKVPQRLMELSNAKNYNDVPPHTNKHQLTTNNTPPIYSIDVPTGSDGRGKMRILFQPCNIDFNIGNLATMTEISILEFTDPH